MMGAILHRRTFDANVSACEYRGQRQPVTVDRTLACSTADDQHICCFGTHFVSDGSVADETYSMQDLSRIADQ